MKVLNIIETAYRATLEEQDDTVIWIVGAMKNANATVDVLLRGNAVNYAIKAQDASGLAFGTEAQTQPPQPAKDLAKLHEKGVRICVIDDALRERGIERSELIEGLDFIKRDQMAKLFGEYDRIWHW